jgi:hypothetical protein
MVALLGLACSPPSSVRTPTPDKVLDAGFVMFPTPRSSDAPGTVFRIDASGVRFDVLDLSPQLSLATSEETFPELASDGTRTVSSKAFFNFLAAVLPVHVSADRTLNYNFTLALFGVRRQKTTDVQIDSVLFPQLPNVRWRDDNKYYVIRETIIADSIKYSFDNTSLTALNADANFKTLVGDSTQIKWRSHESYQLAQQFPHAQRVYYKVDQIRSKTGGYGGAPVLAVEHLPVKSELGYVDSSGVRRP